MCLRLPLVLGSGVPCMRLGSRSLSYVQDQSHNNKGYGEHELDNSTSSMEGLEIILVISGIILESSIGCLFRWYILSHNNHDGIMWSERALRNLSSCMLILIVRTEKLTRDMEWRIEICRRSCLGYYPSLQPRAQPQRACLNAFPRFVPEELPCVYEPPYAYRLCVAVQLNITCPMSVAELAWEAWRTIPFGLVLGALTKSNMFDITKSSLSSDTGGKSGSKVADSSCEWSDWACDDTGYQWYRVSRTSENGQHVYQYSPPRVKQEELTHPTTIAQISSKQGKL